MIQRLIYRLLERRHYWRHVSFSEMAEIYTSRALRMLAVSMASIFVTIYLYQNGYSVAFIGFYVASYFLLRAIMTVPLSFVVARVGPKHAALISNVLYVPALLSLTLLPEYGLIALVGFGVLQAISVDLNDVSYMVNLSKVKHPDHDGKEIGYLQIIDRVAFGISPIIGGGIAYLFGPKVTLMTAALIFLLAAVPLLFSPEQVKAHQKITYAGFPWRRLWRGVIAESAIGADFVMSGAFWSLFLAITIFGTDSNSVYVEIGFLVAATVLVASVAARLYGLFIDRKQAGELLLVGTVFNSLIHFMRPFITTPLGALTINMTNELATTAFTMPFIKGKCDQADDLPGYRIAYLSIMSMIAAVGAALISFVVGLMALSMHEVTALQLGFIIAGFYGLLIALHGFISLKRKR